MKWKSIAGVALAVSLGSVGVDAYFNGFDVIRSVAVASVACLGAALMGFVSTLGKPK
jgi:hypothetical protein